MKTIFYYPAFFGPFAISNQSTKEWQSCALVNIKYKSKIIKQKNNLLFREISLSCELFTLCTLYNVHIIFKRPYYIYVNVSFINIPTSFFMYHIYQTFNMFLFIQRKQKYHTHKRHVQLFIVHIKIVLYVTSKMYMYK